MTDTLYLTSHPHNNPKRLDLQAYISVSLSCQSYVSWATFDFPGLDEMTQREFGHGFWSSYWELEDMTQNCGGISSVWKWDGRPRWGTRQTLTCFQTVVLEKLLVSPLNSKGMKEVNPKGSQPWMFIGRTDAEAEVLILWPPDAKSWLTGKNPDAGKDWRQEKKRASEDEMASLTQWTWVWANSET